MTGGMVAVVAVTLAAFRNSFLPKPEKSPDNPAKSPQSSSKNESDDAPGGRLIKHKPQTPVSAAVPFRQDSAAYDTPSPTSERYSVILRKASIAPFKKSGEAQYPQRRLPPPIATANRTTTADFRTHQAMPTQFNTPQAGGDLNSDARSEPPPSTMPCEEPSGESTVNNIHNSPSPEQNTRIKESIARNQANEQRDLRGISPIIEITQSSPDPQAATSPLQQIQPISSNQLINNNLQPIPETLINEPCHSKQPAGKN
jgi:hypothetical protein